MTGGSQIPGISQGRLTVRRPASQTTFSSISASGKWTLSWRTSGAAWYVIAVAAAAVLFQWWPHLTYQEPSLKTKAIRPISSGLEQ